MVFSEYFDIEHKFWMRVKPAVRHRLTAGRAPEHFAVEPERSRRAAARKGERTDQCDR
jgi:hypothetical protein